MTAPAIKQLAAHCRLKQAALLSSVQEATGSKISKTTISLCINKGYLPQTINGFREAIENYIAKHPAARQWLALHNLQPSQIWQPIQPKNEKSIEEVQMIPQAALKHFKLFRNPFTDDIRADADVYMSDEHRYIEAAMLDAARHGGFLAVVGEVGSGKTVMRRRIIEQLRRENNTLVVYPQMIDKTRLTASSICDAIIMDISNETCRKTLEAKTRQVQKLLIDRARSGYRACLIIEEAHDLNVHTLKYLKRFNELEDGYTKLLGIIIVGQPELKHTFDEGQNVDMREVIQRIQLAEITGIESGIDKYLAIKIKRLNADPAAIFNPNAYPAMARRLTAISGDGKRKISHAYPLAINNLAARAMTLAHGLGEPLVTEEVVNAL